jgi:hypothetical protein
MGLFKLDYIFNSRDHEITPWYINTGDKNQFVLFSVPPKRKFQDG